MTNDDESILKKVRKLGERVRRGVARAHPPKPQQKASVHQIVEAQLRREQLRGKAQLTADRRAEVQRLEQVKLQETMRQPVQEKKSQNKSQSHDKGHSH